MSETVQNNRNEWGDVCVSGPQGLGIILATYTRICYRGTSYGRCLETNGRAATTDPHATARWLELSVLKAPLASALRGLDKKRTHSLMSPSQDAVTNFDYTAISITRRNPDRQRLTDSCGSHSCAITTLECALSRDLMRPVFHSQNTTFPSPSPLLIHLPSGEKPTWQAYPATECPANRLFLACLKLSVLYTNTWLSSDCAAKYFSVKKALIDCSADAWAARTYCSGAA